MKTKSDWSMPARHRQMLRIIARSIDKDGTQPSIREIAEAMGYTAHNYVHYMVQRLEKQGVVTVLRGRCRALSFDWRKYL